MLLYICIFLKAYVFIYIFFYTDIQENAKQQQDIYRSAMLEQKRLKLIENQKMRLLRYMHANIEI
jgi:hypothetical protein